MRPRKRFSYVLSTAVLCWALGLTAPAMAEDLGTVEGDGQLILPVDVRILQGEIAIEIDAVDVTDFAQIVGSTLVVDLGGVISPGTHEVVVYLYRGDTVRVLDSFTFTAGGTAPGAVAWQVELDATHEVDLAHVNGDTTLDGTSSGRISVQNGDGTVTGYLGYIASSREDEQIDGRPVNITDYTLQFQDTFGDTVVTATMGHQALSFDPVLVDGINRRGLSFSLARTDQRLRADVFALRVQDLLGADNLTGLQDSADRMLGARLAARPWAQSDLTFSLQTYSGVGTPYAGLVAGEGRGVSFGLDGSARDGRLRYGLHYGQTRWDEDRTGPLVAQSGEAIWAYASYDVLSPTRTERQLTLGLAYEAVEAGFYSLANPGLPVGTETVRLSADYSADRLWLGLTAETRETNFGGPDTLERDRINYVALDGTYQMAPGRVFTGRALRFGLSTEWQDRIFTPVAGPTPLDFTASGAYLGVDLSHDTASIGAAYTIENFNDQSVFDEDETRQLITLNASYAPNSVLTLTGSYSATHVAGAHGAWWTHEGRATLDYQTRGDWRVSAELAVTETGDALAQSGEFMRFEASRPLGKSAELVLYGSYGEGPYTQDGLSGDEAVIGLLVRANTLWAR